MNNLHAIAVIGNHVVQCITHDCFPLPLSSSCNFSQQPSWCYLSHI